MSTGSRACCSVVLFCLCVSLIATGSAKAVEIECIPVKLCPMAMKLIKTRPNAKDTIQFLRFSHCGFDGKDAKIWCNKFKFCITPDSRNGTCTPIKQCHPYVKMLETLDISNPITKKYMKEFRCTTEFDPNIEVCCPDDKNFRHEHRKPFTSTPRRRPWYLDKTTARYPPTYLDKSTRYQPSSIDKTTPRYPEKSTRSPPSYLDKSTSRYPSSDLDENSSRYPPPFSDNGSPVHDRFADPVLEICGKQLGDDRIVGGVEANLGEFPWMALLRYKDGRNYSYGCSGSLVNARYVLTAAHCLDPYIIERKDLGELYSVVLGEHDTRYDIDCVKSNYGEDCADRIREIKIADTITHPGYATTSVADDLALIRLSEWVEYTDYIKPICLPWKSMRFNESVFFSISGWGRTETESQSPVKRKARIPYRDRSACSSVSGQVLSEAQICAGFGNGTDSCFGDSGGPLMLEKPVRSDFITFVVGIISFGYGGRCGEYPSVHTYVPHYVDWIHQIIT